MTTRELFGIIIVLFVIAMTGYALLDLRLLPIMAFLEFVTGLYSHPRINFKGRPVAGTVVHFIGAFGYFCAGWMVFSPFDHQALALASFFGLVLSAGHFSNEIEDFNNDLAAGMRTNAIVFSQRTVFRVGVILFILSSIFFIGIAAGFLGVSYHSLACGDMELTRPLYLLVSAGLLSVWMVQAWRHRHWKGGDNISKFRSAYRLTYAAFCGLLVGVKIIEWTMIPNLIRIFCVY